MTEKVIHIVKTFYGNKTMCGRDLYSKILWTSYAPDGTCKMCRKAMASLQKDRAVIYEGD